MNLRTIATGIGTAAIGAVTLLVGAGVAARWKPASASTGGTPEAGDSARSAATADAPSGDTALPQPAPTGEEGHAAPDLIAGNDLGPDHRAPAAFRPDIDAPMTPAEREALRPATGPAPSLIADRGDSV